jgi:hypothetical protein
MYLSVVLYRLVTVARVQTFCTCTAAADLSWFLHGHACAAAAGVSCAALPWKHGSTRNIGALTPRLQVMWVYGHMACGGSLAVMQKVPDMQR